MTSKKFHEIFALEVAAISRRRKKHGRPEIKLEEEDPERDGTPVMRPKPGSNVVGLALSGGGIRSAAFCLGALQALATRGLIEKIDYLSSVSGGGYIGTSMTAAMSTGAAGTFPFASELRTGEVPGVQHIRDHSNYLFPQGPLNIFGNVAVYLRGILANVILLLPLLLLAAAFTIWWNPDENALTDTKSKFAAYFVHLPIVVDHFGLTANALLVFVIIMGLWALWRSTPWGRNISDVGLSARVSGALSIAIMVVAFCEWQPLLLNGFFEHTNLPNEGNGIFHRLFSWLEALSAFLGKLSSGLAALLAVIGTVVGFLGRFLADILKRTTGKPGYSASATRVAIKLAIYTAGAASPLILWAIYLELSYWGIQDCAGAVCTDHAPRLTKFANQLPFGDGSILHLYVTVGVPMLIIGWLLSPNANSLHQLYRDRLSKAFLFDPSRREAARALSRLKGMTGEQADDLLRNSDLEPLNSLRVSELSPELAPYHLINTALSIEASKYANRHDRNADFFIFSPLFTGSVATGYVTTVLMEEIMSGLTAGTAMTVSGVGPSPNSGWATVKPLVPSLAILNIRLGYWITNPAAVARTLKKAWPLRLFDKFYFAKELFGLLTEDSETVYLTDGGHIENLGLYELLRRRCKLIIAIDAEADPDMSFGSLAKLERYARMDFGIRVDLPWFAIRNASREASEEVLKSGGLPPDVAPHGPHCALGTIYYPRKVGEKDDTHSTGVLLYIKASFTGDESHYVVDYKRRNPDFPHESSVVQYFTGEQFEVYRALGFHAVNQAFNLVDAVSMKPEPAPWQGATSTLPLERQMRAILAGEDPNEARGHRAE